MIYYGFFYRLVMRIAHRYNWHYAPPIYPEGDTQLWCKWCGFRQTIKTKTNNTKNTRVCNCGAAKAPAFLNIPHLEDCPAKPLLIATELDGSRWVQLEDYNRK